MLRGIGTAADWRQEAREAAAVLLRGGSIGLPLEDRGRIAGRIFVGIAGEAIPAAVAHALAFCEPSHDEMVTAGRALDALNARERWS